MNRLHARLNAYKKLVVSSVVEIKTDTLGRVSVLKNPKLGELAAFVRTEGSSKDFGVRFVVGENLWVWGEAVHHMDMWDSLTGLDRKSRQRSWAGVPFGWVNNSIWKYPTFILDKKCSVLDLVRNLNFSNLYGDRDFVIDHETLARKGYAISDSSGLRKIPSIDAEDEGIVQEHRWKSEYSDPRI